MYFFGIFAFSTPDKHPFFWDQWDDHPPYDSELYDSVSGMIACGEKMKPRVANMLTFYWRHFAYVIFYVI